MLCVQRTIRCIAPSAVHGRNIDIGGLGAGELSANANGSGAVKAGRARERGREKMACDKIDVIGISAEIHCDFNSCRWRKRSGR